MFIGISGHTELVIPKKQNISEKEVLRTIASMVDWVQKNIDNLFERSKQQCVAKSLVSEFEGNFSADYVPEYIYIPFLDESFDISLVALPFGLRSHTLHEIGSTLHLHYVYTSMDAEIQKKVNVAGCCQLLQRWLMRKASPHLKQLTYDLAKKLGLSVNNVQVRNQRKRWGSCSAKQNINLNCRLLLLPHHLAEHVILHELCHLVHLNHSKEFKSLLASVSDDCNQKDIEVNDAWKNLPAWAMVEV